MNASLVIEIDTRPFERIEAELAVSGIFTDDRPLRGGAARADWRLCGLISRLVEAGRIVGNQGERLLVPSAGRLRAPRLLLFGLGERAAFKGRAVRATWADAFSHAFGLGVSDLALAPLGVASDDVPRFADALVACAWAAACEIDAPSRLSLAIAPSSEARVRASVGTAIEATASPALRLGRAPAAAPEAARARPKRSPQGGNPQVGPSQTP